MLDHHSIFHKWKGAHFANTACGPDSHDKKTSTISRLLGVLEMTGRNSKVGNKGLRLQGVAWVFKRRRGEKRRQWLSGIVGRAQVKPRGWERGRGEHRACRKETGSSHDSMMPVGGEVPAGRGERE